MRKGTLTRVTRLTYKLPLRSTEGKNHYYYNYHQNKRCYSQVAKYPKKAFRNPIERRTGAPKVPFIQRPWIDDLPRNKMVDPILEAVKWTTEEYGRDEEEEIFMDSILRQDQEGIEAGLPSDKEEMDRYLLFLRSSERPQDSLDYEEILRKEEAEEEERAEEMMPLKFDTDEVELSDQMKSDAAIKYIKEFTQKHGNANDILHYTDKNSYYVSDADYLNMVYEHRNQGYALEFQPVEYMYTNSDGPTILEELTEYDEYLQKGEQELKKKKMRNDISSGVLPIDDRASLLTGDIMFESLEEERDRRIQEQNTNDIENMMIQAEIKCELTFPLYGKVEGSKVNREIAEQENDEDLEDTPEGAQAVLDYYSSQEDFFERAYRGIGPEVEEEDDEDDEDEGESDDRHEIEDEDEEKTEEEIDKEIAKEEEDEDDEDDEVYDDDEVDEFEEPKDTRFLMTPKEKGEEREDEDDLFPGHPAMTTKKFNEYFRDDRDDVIRMYIRGDKSLEEREEERRTIADLAEEEKEASSTHPLTVNPLFEPYLLEEVDDFKDPDLFDQLTGEPTTAAIELTKQVLFEQHTITDLENLDDKYAHPLIRFGSDEPNPAFTHYSDVLNSFMSIMLKQDRLGYKWFSNVPSREQQVFNWLDPRWQKGLTTLPMASYSPKIKRTVTIDWRGWKMMIKQEDVVKNKSQSRIIEIPADWLLAFKRVKWPSLQADEPPVSYDAYFQAMRTKYELGKVNEDEHLVTEKYHSAFGGQD